MSGLVPTGLTPAAWRLHSHITTSIRWEKTTACATKKHTPAFLANKVVISLPCHMLSTGIVLTGGKIGTHVDSTLRSASGVGSPWYREEEQV